MSSCLPPQDDQARGSTFRSKGGGFVQVTQYSFRKRQIFTGRGTRGEVEEPAEERRRRGDGTSSSVDSL